jgi:hypothetical protein
MKRKTFSGLIKNLNDNNKFVFESNPQGIHRKGTARIALLKFGAIYGKGHGLQCKSYGLATKNLKINFYDDILKITYKKAGLRSISKKQIIDNIKKLYNLAKKMKDKEFLIAYTASGMNLNGYSDMEMGRMFYEAKPIPMNIVFEDNFLKLVYK